MVGNVQVERIWLSLFNVNSFQNTLNKQENYAVSIGVYLHVLYKIETASPHVDFVLCGVCVCLLNAIFNAISLNKHDSGLLSQILNETVYITNIKQFEAQIITHTK